VCRLSLVSRHPQALSAFRYALGLRWGPRRSTAADLSNLNSLIMARPECKTEAHWLTDIEEAPYLMGGDKMVSEAKRRIHRARRQHSKTVIEDQYAEYFYDN
jgi:hypothetical protein